MSDAYKIIDHTYDTVVVGAGGSGLRATMGSAEAGSENRLHYQSIPDPFAHSCRAGRDRCFIGQQLARSLDLAHV